MSLAAHNAIQQRSSELGVNKLAFRNTMEKWDFVKKVPGIATRAGELAGVPVVVVGAGPSLDDALPILKAKRPVIVAVDRAARPLLAAGITPDWIVSVELNPVGALKLRGLRGLEQTPLLFHPSCCPDTVWEYPGPLYTCEGPDVILENGKTENPTKGKGRFPRGTGVIVYAVGLAVHLGAHPVILAGADLAYPEGRTHALGVTECNEVFDGGGDVPSVTGGSVQSDVFFAANVEELSTWFDGTLIQTSPRGALIPGWSHERLEDVL